MASISWYSCLAYGTNVTLLSAWSCPADSTTNVPYPNIRANGDRSSLMSVTFASGIIPIFLPITPLTSMSRFSVMTKYVSRQSLICQPAHATSAKNSSQISRWDTLPLVTPVVLLDEPTTGLDPATESRLIDDLLSVTRGKTLVMVTHQPRLTDRADQVVRVDAGRITLAGSPTADGRPSAVPA